MGDVSATSPTFETGETTPIPFTLSANSRIPTNNGQLIEIDEFSAMGGRLRWELKNPSGEIVYFIETSVVTQGVFPFRTFYVEDVEVYVPANIPGFFPQQGAWRLELWTFDPFVQLVGYVVHDWTFNVGESSVPDTLFAPVYITWGGVAVVGWGAVSFALPAIFWLTCPLWGFFTLAFIIRFWKGSLKIAMRDFRKGIEEINKRRKRKGVER
jgi:hypothetical protein